MTMNRWSSGLALLALFPIAALAQEPAGDEALHREVLELRVIVKELQGRVTALERAQPAMASPANSTAPGAATPLTTPALQATPPTATPANTNVAPAPTSNAPNMLGALGGTTANFLFDGYYGYNFNAPIGRANLLRAYDVSSNSFSINQADLVLENAPDPANGKRWGARLDLQFGQATQTLQGNSANEPRPEIYREIFQAYGTYVAPLGKGLTIDFGKWSSSVGLEGNYTKDQINYSRSFWFDYLPFYHMGLRMNYKVNDALAVNYWVTNGTNQTEAYNGYKDQLFGFVLTPNKNNLDRQLLSWPGTSGRCVFPERWRPGRRADAAGHTFRTHSPRCERPLEYLRQLRNLASNSQTRFRPGIRLGSRTPAGQLYGSGNDRRRRLHPPPYYR
jgi:hypothetical protein